MRPRHLLLITYPWPPMPSVGVNRWTALARHLAPLGVSAEVVTTGAFGRLDDDADRGVHRAYDLVAEPRLRRLVRRPALPAEGAPVETDTPPPRLLASAVPPDVHTVTWAPWALRETLRAVRRRRPDVLVTTTPYESTHLVGLAVARRTGLPWIADFRDGWTFEPHRPAFPLALQDRLDRSLERAVVRRADVTLAATLPIAEDFRERLGVPAVHLPNAWDPDLERLVAPAEAPPLRPDRVSLVHTGRLSGGWGRTPEPVLEGLRIALRMDPALGERLEVVLAGRLDRREEALLADGDLAAVVRHVGAISRGGALSLQRQADALLLITSANAGEATGKLFEYLGAGRPILALADGNEAARIVRATGTGVCVPPGDPERIARALVDLAAHGLARKFAPRDLEPYVLPGPARLLAEEIERAIGRRGA